MEPLHKIFLNMEKTQSVRRLGELRRDGVVDSLVDITENNDAVPVANLKDGVDALEEPSPCGNTLLLSCPDCNREDVPVPVYGGRNEDDTSVLRFEVTPVDTKHFQ